MSTGRRLDGRVSASLDTPAKPQTRWTDKVRPLDDDERAAYHRFRIRAQALGSISRSFDTLAAHVTEAYREALAQHDPRSWTTLVGRTALFVARVHDVDGVVTLADSERDALDFFEAIVHENADLLTSL